MRASRPFFDTNVLLYALSADPAKADRSEELLESGGTISVQVLNEFAAVARRKLSMPVGEIRATLSVVRALCTVRDLDARAHDLGLDLMERYSLATYDAMIVASALAAECDVLFTEDMQAGLSIRDLRLVNPYV